MSCVGRVWKESLPFTKKKRSLDVMSQFFQFLQISKLTRCLYKVLTKQSHSSL